MNTQTQEPSALGRIVELVRDLRQRCPWDAKQTPQTLRPYLVEEVLELDQAIAREDPDEIRVELGDMLLHLAFQIVLGEEAGHFGAEDVTHTIETKMKRRHPHLFEEAGVPESWEIQKKKELDDGGSVLDGLPDTLPPTLRAYRLQERAAGVGFDWPDAAGPRDKIREELDELDRAVESADSIEIETELGDLMFSMVNLARKLGVDPRAAFEASNSKFERRFRRIEDTVHKRGLDLSEMSLAELDAIWDEVKDVHG